MKPVLWLLGGFDPTGGAGILRDLCTNWGFERAVNTQVAVTAWTRQGKGLPASAQSCEPVALSTQLSTFLPPQAVKLGLIPRLKLAEVIIQKITNSCPIVVDPVMFASDGGNLGGDLDAYRYLAKHASLVTPNRMEAAKFVGVDINDKNLLERVANHLASPAVLLKGGHHRDPVWVIDELWMNGEVHTFKRKRQPGPDPRGTGCALATRIACGLSHQQMLVKAVRDAILWLDGLRKHWVLGVDEKAHLPLG